MFDIKVNFVLTFRLVLSVDQKIKIIVYSLFFLNSRDPSQQRVKKWGFSLEEALKDPAGRDQFLKFVESEFSSENLR